MPGKRTCVRRIVEREVGAAHRDVGGRERDRDVGRPAALVAAQKTGDGVGSGVGVSVGDAMRVTVGDATASRSATA